jgi:LL-diaminopimelate aminotransferase
MAIDEADRLKALPPYLFAEIDRIIQVKKEKGEDVISLGIGDPDIPTPNIIIDSLCKGAKDPKNHRYPSSYGMDKFKNAVADFYKKRFNVELNPENEIIPLWGSKEGIANIAYTFLNPGDYSIVPDPGYLVYKIGTMFAGGIPYVVPLKEENDFLMKFSEIDKKVGEKAKILYINYPNNPTSASCDLGFFEKSIEFADKFNMIVCHDNAYSDIYFDNNDKPASFLNAGGSKELGIEFNSLSKTFNMTGWRIGYAVGNKDIISSLGKYKTNVDSGVFNAVQIAAIEAFKNYDDIFNNNMAIYKKRRNIIFDSLKKIGISYYKSNSTIYIWAKVPKDYSSKSFAELLLNKANVVVTPGSAFGDYGEGYFRISITLSDDRLEEALERIKKVL